MMRSVDWRGISAALERRRTERGFVTRSELWRAAGIDRNTGTKVLRGERVSLNTLRALSVALGWSPDSLERVGNGEPPIERSDRTAPQPGDWQRLDEKLDRVVEELSELKRYVAEIDERLAGRAPAAGGRR